MNKNIKKFERNLYSLTNAVRRGRATLEMVTKLEKSWIAVMIDLEKKPIAFDKD